jgi:hypothetical protein
MHKVPSSITNLKKKQLLELKSALEGQGYDAIVRFAKMLIDEKTRYLVKYDPRGRTMYEFGVIKGELQSFMLLEQLADLVEDELKNRASIEKDSG